MKKRRSRRNAWFGFPLLHKRTAVKGHRRSRKSRRTRRNAGSVVTSARRAVTSGFKMSVLKKAGTVLAGTLGASFIGGHIQNMFPFLKRNKVLDVLTVLGVASIDAAIVKKIKPAYASDILVGGLVAGLLRGAKAVLPNQFNACGLGEDLEGLRDDMEGLGAYYATPGQVMHPIGTSGMGQLGWAPGPRTPVVGTSGMNDYALHAQVQPGNVVQLDGMDDVISEVSSQI